VTRLYTRLFVDGRSPLAGVLATVTASVSGRVESGTVFGAGCALDARTNDDYSSQALQRDPADFVYFPYTVEIEAAGERMSLKQYLGVVGTVMQALAGAGMRVVAACDWEDRLPGRGRLGL